MKQIAIRKHYSYFITNTSEIKDCVFDEKIDSLDAEITELFSKYDLKLISHITRFIQLEKMSVSFCEKCENLMVNRDKTLQGLVLVTIQASMLILISLFMMGALMKEKTSAWSVYLFRIAGAIFHNVYTPIIVR